jgi:pseudaminic acid cytidylyltransferase
VPQPVTESNATAPGPLVAIIPARGGSKRIPGKNIRPFLGVPLLARTVQALRDANLFDRIVVSTDDEAIAEAAIRASAEVPFMRDPALSDDHTPTAPVVADAVRRLEAEMGVLLDPVCVVYPAAVFVRGSDLRSALQSLLASKVSLVFSAASFPAPIERAWQVDDDGDAKMIRPEFRLTRSQDLTTAYHDAGLFYWGTRDYWLAAGDADQQSQRARLHVLPRWRAVDIDTVEDWEQAELLYSVAAASEERAP